MSKEVIATLLVRDSCHYETNGFYCASEKIRRVLNQEDVVKGLVEKAIDWAFTHGLVIRTKSDEAASKTVEHGPFTLFPTPFPRKLLQQAIDLQQPFNELYHKIAMDTEFLGETLKGVIETDDFVRRLWDVHVKVEKEGRVQPVHMCMSRSDYMIDSCEGCDPALLQVEYNCIASSMSGTISLTNKLHRYVLQEADIPFTEFEYPTTTCLEELAKGLTMGWRAYDSTSAVVLFVVGENERNRFDQRLLEYEARRQCPELKVISKTFEELHTIVGVNGNRELLIDGQEVALVYYRNGYSPEQYNDKAWEVRLLLERSKAIQCPSTAYMLANFKKIQQTLYKEGVVEQFISDSQKATALRSCFAVQYGFDDDRVAETLAIARENPNNFVMKPQREGGGHNTYGADILPLLDQCEKDGTLGAYVLMKFIKPLEFTNILVRTSVPVKAQVISELGIYGTCLGTKEQITANITCSHMMRTKMEGVFEGGVAAGFGHLDTPILI